MYFYGIDISHWNGSIDFSKVDKSFVIAKVSQAKGKDSKFDTYYNSCKIPMGAYIYNKVKSVADARIEAEFAIKTLNGRKLDLGVWLDMEDASMRKLGKNVLTDIILTESDIIRKAGYNVGIYCNKDWYTNVLDSSLLANSFPFWIARYPSADNGTIKESLNPSSLKGCKIWQYSSKGKVNGMSGNTDLNVSFVDPLSIFTDKPIAVKEDALSEANHPTLRVGSKNTDVIKLQKILNSLGYSLVEDGIYGVKTKAAVTDYQIKYNLTHVNKLAIDGIVGKQTWASLGN